MVTKKTAAQPAAKKSTATAAKSSKPAAKTKESAAKKHPTKKAAPGIISKAKKAVSEVLTGAAKGAVAGGTEAVNKMAGVDDKTSNTANSGKSAKAAGTSKPAASKPAAKAKPAKTSPAASKSKTADKTAKTPKAKK